MSDLKLKGTNVKFRLTAPYGAVTEVRKTTDAEATILREILEEQFLGENEPDFGSVNNGVSVKVSLVHDDPSFPRLFKAIVDKTNGESSPLGMFTMIGTMFFPSGKVVRCIASDLEFGDLGLKFASRKAYATTPLEGKCKRLEWKF